MCPPSDCMTWRSRVGRFVGWFVPGSESRIQNKERGVQVVLHSKHEGCVRHVADGTWVAKSPREIF